MDRPGVREVLEGNGEQGKWRKLVVKSSVVPQTTLAVNGEIRGEMLSGTEVAINKFHSSYKFEKRA